MTVEGYAERISYVLRNPREVSRIGEEGASMVEERFDYVRWAKEFKQFIDRLLGNQDNF